MSLRPVLVRAVIGAVVVGLLSGACGGGDDEVVPPPATISAGRLPERVLGLAVTPEETESLVEGRTDSYFDAVGLWGLREGTRLQATLQVADFNEQARPEDPRFRDAIAAQVSNRPPQQFKMGNQTVYVASGSRQGVAIWFFDETMYVLSTRAEYEAPRALLRALVENVL